MSTPGLVEIYLSFDGNCLEALSFYAELLGGTITQLSQWSDLPSDEPMEDGPEINPEWVMHAQLEIGRNKIMAGDNLYRNTVFGDSVTLTWSHPDATEVQRVWDGFIASGATVEMALEPSFFAKQFGYLTDPFGINWQILQWQSESEQ